MNTQQMVKEVIKLKNEFEHKVSEYLQQELDKLNEALREHNITNSLGWCVDDIECNIVKLTTFGNLKDKVCVDGFGINMHTTIFDGYNTQTISIDSSNNLSMECKV